MILTGPQIAAEVALGRILISDFDPERVEPNSYGFRLAPEVMCYETDSFDAFSPAAVKTIHMGELGHVFEPGRFYLGATAGAIGSPHYAATLYASRSVSTLGVWIQFSAPLGHSGAIIPWTLELKVARAVRLYPGMIIGKIAFWTMRGEPGAYDGKYTGSTSVVASRMGLDRETAAATKATVL